MPTSKDALNVARLATTSTIIAPPDEPANDRTKRMQTAVAVLIQTIIEGGDSVRRT
jgi:hypothetical protein